MIDMSQMAERESAHISGDAFPAWSLPPDRTAPGAARSIVRTVFGGMGLPPDAVDDAQTVISELATNAVLHGDRQGAEVWAYISHLNGPHVTLKVFDSAPWRGAAAVPVLPAEPSDSSGGRGLTLATALTAEIGGRWGVHPTRSRLGAKPVPGKAVYFTVPLPKGSPITLAPVTRWPAHERICALTNARGLRPFVSFEPEATVVHFAGGPWVWVRDGSLLYDRPGHAVVRHPVWDVVELVEQVVRHHEELATAGSTCCAPSWDLH